MSKTRSLIAPLLLAVGLAACGQNAATAEDRAESAAAAQAVPEKTGAADRPVDGEAGSPMPAAVEAASAVAQEAPAATTTVKTLPLKRGFYVASDTPCNRASNATLSLLGSDGFTVAGRDFCTFRKIEKTGAASYRVTEECSSGGEAWGSEEQKDTNVVVWEISGDSTYKRRNQSSGWESSARYCAQSSLPEPWRDNDISDLIR